MPVIWLAWRQSRTPVAIAVALLAAITIVAALTGPNLAHLYATTVATCSSLNDCNAVDTEYLKSDHFLQAVLPSVLLVAPALIGAFLGAPLVAHELESGSYKLSWTQGVTRLRWLAVKLGLLGLPSVIVAGLLSLVLTWWFSPIDRLNLNRFTPAMFGVRGITPIGYAAFAFVLGALVGAVMARTLPAMALTVVGFLGARLAVTYWIRPRLRSPLHASFPLLLPLGPAPAPTPGAGAIPPGSWILSSTTIDGSGRVVGQNGGIGPNGQLGLQVSPTGTVSIHGVGTCPGLATPGSGGRASAPSAAVVQRAFDDCARHFGLRNLLSYQPASRYWSFQWDETAIFFALALALGAVSLWWVRRRLA